MAQGTTGWERGREDGRVDRDGAEVGHGDHPHPAALSVMCALHCDNQTLQTGNPSTLPYSGVLSTIARLEQARSTRAMRSAFHDTESRFRSAFQASPHERLGSISSFVQESLKFSRTPDRASRTGIRPVVPGRRSVSAVSFDKTKDS